MQSRTLRIQKSGGFDSVFITRWILSDWGIQHFSIENLNLFLKNLK